MDRYEEALERAKKGLPIDEVFPELKESNDERIRKELISFVNKYYGEETKKEVLAYLEKQKEQKPIPSLDRGDEIILKAICERLKDAPGWVERIEGWYSLAKDAQHPAEWSEEDSVTLDCAVEVMEKAGIPSLAASLKSLKNRGNSHKSNTNSPSWKPSKKQIVALGCVRYVDRNCATELESLYNDLKKL